MGGPWSPRLATTPLVQTLRGTGMLRLWVWLDS
jgi:hypothetical protein